MFLPKGRQLSAMGRDGVYAEDRTDVYTGSSSTQSTGKIILFRAIISYILKSLNINQYLKQSFNFIYYLHPPNLLVLFGGLPIKIFDTKNDLIRAV